MVLTGKMRVKILELGLVLDERVAYNRRWRKVKLNVKSRYLEIRWFSPRKRPKSFDPKGKRSFKSIRVAPLSLKAIEEEIVNQEKKLRRDQNV